MSPNADIVKFFKNRGCHASGCTYLALPSVVKDLYEWGSSSIWDISHGLRNRPRRNALKLLVEAGLAKEYPSDNEVHAYITDEGLAFVERFRLSPYVPEETG